MSQDNSFTYRYSAKENEELQKIRDRYLPRNESRLEELKRLDKEVQKAGTVEALSVGIVGLLVFGLGMCLAMKVIRAGTVFFFLGVVLGIIGALIMAAAYFVNRKIHAKTKEKYTKRILELTDELAVRKENTI